MMNETTGSVQLHKTSYKEYREYITRYESCNLNVNGGKYTMGVSTPKRGTTSLPPQIRSVKNRSLNTL